MTSIAVGTHIARNSPSSAGWAPLYRDICGNRGAVSRVLQTLLPFVACAPLLGGSQATAGPNWLIDSGAARVTLLELYSSEGCSSCPPAEKWVGRLRQHPGLWRRVVPVNLHVSYWDRLGWPDRFASAELTERQYRYASHLGIQSVYTPEFFLNGREWRGFFDGDALAIDEGATVGPLRLAVSGDEVSAEFFPAGDPENKLALHVAILGFDLESKVRSGENRGRTLVQNFVLLELETAEAEWASDHFEWQLPLPVPRNEWPSKVALAAWVTALDDPTPIQAAGAELPQD